MEKKTNTKALTGIFAFCLGAMPGNMTLGLIAYIMQSYSTVSTTTVAMIMTMPSLVAMIYAFFVGSLNTKISAKNLLIFGQICLVIYAAIFCFLGGKAPIYVLLGGAALAGFGQGSNNTLLGVLLLDAVPDDQKRKNILGIAISAMSLGGVFFTTVGGFLAVNHWQHAYYLWFIIVLFIVLEFVCLPNRKPEGSKQPAADTQASEPAGKLPVMVWIIATHYLLWFMFMYVYGLNVSEYVITRYQLGTSAESGIAASLVTVGGVVSGMFFGTYAKFLKKWTVPFAMGLTAIGLYLPLVMTTNILGIYICGLFGGFSMSAANPYIISHLAEIVPANLYSKAMSIYSGFMNVGMFIAIYVIAFFTKLVCGDAGDVHYKFVVGCVGALICTILSIPIYVVKGKKAA